MNIVLEGPDGAGKSTLAAELAAATGVPVIPGEGPPKSAEEFETRINRYANYHGVIFDRHPCISDPIYAAAMGRPTMVRPRQIARFFETRPFIIYVRPTTHYLQDHAKHDHESEEHHANVALHHSAICRAYDERMLHIAHYVKRRTDTYLGELARGGALRSFINADRRILT